VGHHVGDGHEPTLRHRIGGEGRVAEKPVDRAVVDDCAAAGLRRAARTALACTR
jgi:hypothetical protein